MKSILKEEFLIKCENKFKNKFDYSFIKYKDFSITKIKIKCIKHDYLFETTPKRHLLKNGGCAKCANNYSLNTKEFIEKSISIHGNIYNYENTQYVNSSKRVKIVCRKHDLEFEQLPQGHLSGGLGCKKCIKDHNIKFLIKRNEILKKSKILFTSDKYILDNINYQNATDKLEIICKKHGNFKVTPISIIYGDAKCKRCVYDEKLKNLLLEYNKKHKYRYDYSLIKNYKNTKQLVKIICNKHGIFSQIAGLHLKGANCPKCCNEIRNDNVRYTKKEFIEKCKKIHEDLYDYSKVKYINIRTKIIIICKKHDLEFKQNAASHMNGGVCPRCTIISKGEGIIANYLKENDIAYYMEHCFINCRYLLPLRFDFYLPKLNTCIEFDGIQHFKPRIRFGGIEGFKIGKIKDQIKNEYCKNNNIKLIRILYYEDYKKILDKELK